MTVSAHISAKSIQNRQILHLVGIPLWAKKVAGQTPIRITAMGDRLQPNPRLSHLLPKTSPSNLPAPDEVVVDKITKKTNTENTNSVPQQIKNSVLTSEVLAQNQPVSLPDNFIKIYKNDESHYAHQAQSPQQIQTLDTRFHLQGIRFGRWILIVDMFSMTQDEQELWYSLKNALIQVGEEQVMMTVFHELRYPMAKNEFRSDEKLNPAKYAFDGFIMGLIMQGGYTECIDFLSDIPTGLTEKTSYELPKISEMMINTDLKKMVWQKLMN